ncbi:MAG: hypothetical protein JXA54_03675 [Candidatus Heimdallarchaeota archaeon]|nr:hypothetical protein [Candidatus Heimdallarchaeota archaeon]
MKKTKLILASFQIFLVIFSIFPLKLMDLGESTPLKNNYNKITSNTDYNILPNFPIASTDSNTWNKVDNSNIINQFQISDSFNEKQTHFEINNANDWSIKNDFHFSNVREEKILNGDAESSDTLWTDYLPSNYEGNVTRVYNPPSGEVLTGNYSWYFDIQTNDHPTIVGFDNPINVSSNSVIFSFSYSLLRNNLGSSYDSNICIRLFFQFDIYIFIWFKGNTAILSNVTGPGGYADLLINQASFDGTKNEYLLNVTALGLELFNQTPDQLRSLAIQTWGEIPYQMEFMLDDISLTEKINPMEIGLEVNGNLITGEEGLGSVTFIEGYSSNINYNIGFFTTKKILWDCNYTLTGTNKKNTERFCNFENWTQIRWVELFNESYLVPSGVSNINTYKWIPKEWTFNFAKVDNIATSFIIDDTNLTHQRIKITTMIFEKLEFQYFSENYIDNLILSDYEITHNDIFSISLESRIYNKEIHLYIINSINEIVYTNINLTNSYGDASFSNIELSSELAKGSYSIIMFWYLCEHIGIGQKNLEITTFPTKIEAINDFIVINFNQIFTINVIFLNLEENQTINFAKIEYNWDYGFGQLQQDPITKYYYTNIDSNGINPGIYLIEIVASKQDYANAICYIEIKIIFSEINLSLMAPNEVIPGEIIPITASIIDNNSNPIPSMGLRFKINAVLYLDSWTNNSGSITILYPLSPVYQFSTLNISCAIIINNIEFLTETISIVINLFDLPRIVSLNEPNQTYYFDTNETTSFSFQIQYPSIGSHWYVNIPTNYLPIRAVVQTSTNNFTANISPGYISWVREIEETQFNTDILIIEISKPKPVYEVNLYKNSIVIDLHFQTNMIPFNGVQVLFLLETEWLKFDKWNLYFNNIDVSNQCELEFLNNQLYFKIFSSDQITLLNYQLKGSKTALIQISSSTIILGIGTLILTIVSTILLRKKKTNLSLDIQM